MFSVRCHLTSRLTQASRLIYLNNTIHSSSPVCNGKNFNKKKPSNKTNNKETVSPKKEKLKNFSFIQIKQKESSKADPVNLNSNESIEEDTSDVRHAISHLMKQQESIATKLAKLIDKLEPSKTAQKLLEPVNEIKRNKPDAKLELKKESQSARKRPAESSPVAKK